MPNSDLIKTLKATTSNRINELPFGNYIPAGQLEKPPDHVRDKRNRVRNALVSVGNLDLYKRYWNCVFGPNPITTNSVVCGSPYCAGCRNNLAMIAQKKVRDRLNYGKWNMSILTRTTPLLFEEYEEIYSPSEYSNDDLKHITAVVGICPVRKHDVQQLIKKDSTRWKRVARRLNKLNDALYWIESVYEYELVNWEKLQQSDGSEHKKTQMAELISQFGQQYEEGYFLFVHHHGLTNLPKSHIRTVFASEYFVSNKPMTKTDKECGVYIQSLHVGKTLEENVKKITSYPFKDAYRYKHTYVGSDYANGEYFTSEELGRLVSLYNEVQGRAARTLFRSFSNDVVQWKIAEEHLLSKIDKTREIATKYRRSQKGRDGLDVLIHLVTILKKLKTQKGNIATKHLTSMITSDLERSRLIASRTVPWKLSEPFPLPKRGRYKARRR